MRPSSSFGVAQPPRKSRSVGQTSTTSRPEIPDSSCSMRERCKTSSSTTAARRVWLMPSSSFSVEATVESAVVARRSRTLTQRRCARVAKSDAEIDVLSGSTAIHARGSRGDRSSSPQSGRRGLSLRALDCLDDRGAGPATSYRNAGKPARGDPRRGSFPLRVGAPGSGFAIIATGSNATGVLSVVISARGSTQGEFREIFHRWCRGGRSSNSPDVRVGACRHGGRRRRPDHDRRRSRRQCEQHARRDRHSAERCVRAVHRPVGEHVHRAPRTPQVRSCSAALTPATRSSAVDTGSR